MNQQSAKTVAEFRAVVDKLEEVYNRALHATTDVELAEANSKLSTMFRALQWNLYSLAQAAQRNIDSRRAGINSGRVRAAIEEDRKAVSEAIENLQASTTIEEPKKDDAFEEAVKKLEKAEKKRGRGRPKKVQE